MVGNLLNIRHEKEFSQSQGLRDGASDSLASRTVVFSRMLSSRSGAVFGCQSSDEQSLVSRLEAWRPGSLAGCRPNRAIAQTETHRTAAIGNALDRGAASRWLFDRPLDAAANCPSRQANISRAIPSGPCLEAAGPAELELSATGEARQGTRRSGHSPLVAARLAPHKKTARRRRALLVFLDESGFSESPVVCRTWAPRGQTPLLIAPFNWKRLSAIASLITTPAARRVGLCLRLHPGSIKQPQIIAYLCALKRHVHPRQVILLWDRLPGHRGARVQGYVRRQAAWLKTEYLPPYAPELNPVEYFWSHLSRTDLANFSGQDLSAVRRQVRRGSAKVRHRNNLGRAFLKHSKLF